MYLLDTDHVSILQRGSSAEFARLMARCERFAESDIFVSIVSFHEQTRGAHEYVNRAKTPSAIERGYLMFASLLKDYCVAQVVGFDQVASLAFAELRRKATRVGTMDLRIAATAISRSWTLLTRNSRDFSPVPGLKSEDWTL